MFRRRISGRLPEQRGRRFSRQLIPAPRRRDLARGPDLQRLEAADLLTIKADRSYVLEEASGPDVGTYKADALTYIRSGTGTVQHSTSQNYVIDRDQLLIGALLPTGETDGVVGDGTATRCSTSRSSRSIRRPRRRYAPLLARLVYRWPRRRRRHVASRGGDFIARLTIGTTTTDFHWKAISNRAIGNPCSCECARGRP